MMDTCTLSDVQGTASEPITITSAGDGPVIIDGTINLNGSWTETIDHKYSLKVNNPILQLFVNDQLYVLARYPNAKFSDKSVFYAVSNWFRSAKGGTHNLNTGEGLLRDQKKCAMPSACCSRCNTHDLAASKINATDAMLVANLWSCDTGIQKITGHDVSEPGILRYNATYKGLCDTYRGGDGRYFVYGARQLLDAPEEWLLSKDEESSYQVLVSTPPSTSDKVTGRVLDYALAVNSVKWLVMSNMSFHAATVSIAGDVGNVTLSSLVFNYSAVSRRSLNRTDPPKTLALWRTRDLDNKDKMRPSGFVLKDLIVRYSDGPALMLSGRSTNMYDCLFEWNDWTTAGGSWPEGVPIKGKGSRATTIRVNDDDGILLHRLTFRNNGAAQSIDAGGATNTNAANVDSCFFQTQLAIQDDGSFVEGGGTPSTMYTNNWCTNTGKSGLRWDGLYPGTLGGVMSGNVVWNATGLVVKGDQHNVTGNTVFDGSDTTPSHAAHDRPRYQDYTSVLNNWTVASVLLGAGTKEYNPKANQLTLFTRNLFDLIEVAGAHCPNKNKKCVLPGKYDSNLIGTPTPQDDGISFDIRSELRDPYHMDFRRCPKSNASKLDAGAYSDWSPSDKTYQIPGRRDKIKASTPLPPTGSLGIYLNTDLMFLPGREALNGHNVYFGESKTTMKLIKTLEGVNNIVQLEHPLKTGTTYMWRVDVRSPQLLVDLDLVGDVWTFETNVESMYSCHIPPRPPPSPLPPGPGKCKAAENMLCPGDAGKGDKSGDKCFECVVTHSKDFLIAGCWNRDQGGKNRHAFIVEWCGGS